VGLRKLFRTNGPGAVSLPAGLTPWGYELRLSPTTASRGWLWAMAFRSRRNGCDAVVAHGRKSETQFDLPRRIWFYLVVESAPQVSREHRWPSAVSSALAMLSTAGDQAESVDARV
jgi:hypothetical protein